MQRLPYPTDLSDAEWHRLAPLIPPAKSGGRPRTQNMREIFNAIYYLLAAGCSWRMLPHDLPAHQTVYGYFHAWSQDGTWERINAALPPADPNAARDLASQDAAIKRRQQDRAEAEANAAKASAEDKALLERCVQARGRMLALRNEGALYRYNEKGDKVYFDAAERERAIAETDRVLRELNCAPLVNAPGRPSTTVNAPAGTSTTPTY